MEEYPNFGWGVVCCLLHSFTSGLAYMYMRKLGTDVDPNTSLFIFGLWTLVFGFATMLALDNFEASTYDWYTISLLIGICITGWSA